MLNKGGIDLKKLLICLLLIFAIAPVSLAEAFSDDELIKIAQEFFGQYKNYNEHLDLQLIELYSDTAVIEMTRNLPDNLMMVVKITGSDYKALLRQSQASAEAKEDIDKFYNEKFTVLKKAQVKIDCTRYSTMRKYECPHQLIIQIDSNRKYQIIYEKVTIID